MRKIIYYGISTDAPFLTPPPFLPKFLELRLAMRSIPWRHTGHRALRGAGVLRAAAASWLESLSL